MADTQYKPLRRQYYFSLTEVCNWKCEYCDFTKKGERKVAPIEQVLEAFALIKEVTGGDKGIEFSLEGGEIGTLSEEYLDQVFNSGLADTYAICTNGLFMERGYHERYKDKIHYILYHVTPDLTDDYNFPVYEVAPNITQHYTIVVTKENIDHLDGLLLAHPEKMWLPHIMQPRTEDLEFLAKDHYFKLNNIVKEKENVTTAFRYRIPKIIGKCDDLNWLEYTRSICANVYAQPIFDLPNMQINRCCISITGDAVPFNEENLTKLYRNEKLFSTKKDKVCDGCIANFLWHPHTLNEWREEAEAILNEFDNENPQQ